MRRAKRLDFIGFAIGFAGPFLVSCEPVILGQFRVAFLLSGKLRVNVDTGRQRGRKTDEQTGRNVIEWLHLNSHPSANPASLAVVLLTVNFRV